MKNYVRARPQTRTRVKYNLSARRTSFNKAKSTGKKAVTRTLTKLAKSPRARIDYSGPTTSSYGFIPYRPELKLTKALKSMTGMQTMVCDRSVRLEWPQGTQGVVNGASLFSYEDMANMVTLYGNLVTPNQNFNHKFYIHDVKSSMMITNQSTDICKVTIYDCLARYGGTSQSYFTPEAAWNTGLVHANNQVTADQRCGGKPFTVPGFTENWYVAKTTELTIATGGHHIHYLNPKVRQVVSRDYVMKSASTYSCWPKLSAYCLVVAHGFPVNDSTTKTNISTAQGALAIAHVKEYHLKILSEAQSSLNLQTTSFVNGSQAIVNDESGAIGSVQVT